MYAQSRNVINIYFLKDVTNTHKEKLSHENVHQTRDLFTILLLWCGLDAGAAHTRPSLALLLLTLQAEDVF